MPYQQVGCYPIPGGGTMTAFRVDGVAETRWLVDTAPIDNMEVVKYFWQLLDWIEEIDPQPHGDAQFAKICALRAEARHVLAQCPECEAHYWTRLSQQRVPML